MKVPLRWLGDYVEATISPTELADRLTMSGSLVERVVNTGSHLGEIVVGRLSALERVAGSDHLWLATVDLGDRSQTVVTGAQNLFAGAFVPFIGLGKRLPGQEQPLKPKKLAGIVSEGMVCSGKELGLSEDHSGILILTELLPEERLADRIGDPLSEVLGEWVLEIEVTPNRPDCLSIYGIAREVAAITNAPLRPPPSTLLESSTAADGLAAVEIEATDLCRRFVGRVITEVRVGPSPAWLVERLQAAGMRSINNIVDVTNYVMLELGQPLHAYDLDNLAGHYLVARRARPGERLVTLDGVDRELTPDMLVIADRERPVGVAGVMGGLDSEVTPTTRRILLEAANFNAQSVRRTGLALGMRSEASSRFEKGLPPPLALLAANRAAGLLAELSGGSVAQGALDVDEPPRDLRSILFPTGEIPRLLGVAMTQERIGSSLEALGFASRADGEGRLEVTVPWWRNDVDESADLVEEVARLTGYDAIPETLLRGSVPVRPQSEGQRWYWPTRQLLLGCGLSEGSSPALTSRRTLEMLRPAESGDDWIESIAPHPQAVREADATFQLMRVVNQLTPDREYLRPTLLAGVLEALRDNLRAGEDRAAFFELDWCAFPRAHALPFERRTLAIAMAGERAPRSWATPAEPFDFFDLKGIVQALLARLGLRDAPTPACGHALLHPGRAAQIQLGDMALGFFGELHPRIAERWDLGAARAYVLELDFDALAGRASADRAFVDYPRLPFAKRDLAVVVDMGRSAEEVQRVIRGSAKGLLARLTLFDLYQGAPLEAGKKSLAFSLDLQAQDATLREEEVDKIINRIKKALEHQVGASFRA